MDLNNKKDEIQRKAIKSHLEFDCFSTICAATGVGKSRCAVLRAIEIVKENPNARLFLTVPTTKLRDENWKQEFSEWGASIIYENNLVKSCYVSMHKYEKETFDFVILDEAHHITPACLPFFFNNDIKSVMGLTATPPSDKIKKELLNSIAPISFVYSLQQALKDKIVAPFEINVIYTDLDSKNKVIEAGPKNKRFKTTELLNYKFLDESFEKNKNQIKDIETQLFSYGWSEKKDEEYKKENNKDFYLTLSKDAQQLKEIKSLIGKRSYLLSNRYRIIGSRKSLINNSLNKERLAKRFLDEKFSQNKRYLVFCGSIPQSFRLLGNNCYNSSTDSVSYNKFLNQEINILGVVNAINEGVTINNLDEALVIQISAQELHFIQRLGRIIRLRDNHIGKIHIIVLRGTQDEVWLKSALNSFPKEQINFFEEQDFFK